MGSSFVSDIRCALKYSERQLRRMELAAARWETARFRHRDDQWTPFGEPIAVGSRYGDLTVEEILGRKPGSRSTCVYVVCSCRCGGDLGPGWRIVRADNLREGRTTSCGCFRTYKDVRLRCWGPGTAARGRYQTYVMKPGLGVVCGQSALALLDWPRGSEYRKRGVDLRDVLLRLPANAEDGAGG